MKLSEPFVLKDAQAVKVGLPPEPDLAEARRLLAAGMKLVKLHHNSKRPVGEDWNHRPAAAIDPNATGYGIPLALNGLASIDPDHVEMARAGLAAWGFDLEELMGAGVRTESTRPNSGGRAAFAADPEGMARWLPFRVYDGNGGVVTVLELRDKSENLQDVVPGLVYADQRTGELYTQRYANERRFDDAPALPDEFAKLWRFLSTDDEALREYSERFTQGIIDAGFDVNGKRPCHVVPMGGGEKLAFPAPGIRREYNAEHPVEDILERHDYRYHGRLGRWSHPSATGAPGIRPIPGKDGLWQSDHGGDRLHGTFDAWAAHVQLDHGGDLEAAITAYQHQKAAQDFDALTLPDAMDTAEDAQEGPQEAGEGDPGPAFGYTLVGDMVDHLKPIDWQVKGFLEADSMGLIYGPPKCGKSFLAIDWACSIATGTPWNGRKVKQGTVFYLAGEGHNGLARRFVSWSLAKGVSLKGAPLAVSNKAAPLTDKGAAALVLKSIDHLVKATGQEPAVIVVDTLARNFGADENSTEDMGRFIQHLDEIRANWKCTVLVVHHTGKDKTRGARGNTALTGAIDAGYMVDRDELGNVNLEPTEMKDAELPSPLAFSLEGIKLPLVDEDGNDVFGAYLSELGNDYQPPKRGKTGRGKNQTMALSKLAELTREHQERLEGAGRDPEDARVTVTDWRAACIDGGLKPQRWAELRRTLEDAGLVEVNAPYVHYTGA